MSEEVRKMFASISGRYDLLNSVLSFGIHKNWRDRAVRESGAMEGMSVLDCAAGTGDFAIAFKEVVGESGTVIGTDFCAEMLEAAPEKSKKKGLQIDWEIADVMNLPFPNGKFDISSIGFGIRNVDDSAIALTEMARVVKPDGKVVILEFGQPYGFIRYPYKWHSKYIIPILGGWISGNKEAYNYLPETSAAFPAGENFVEMMEKTGMFKAVTYVPLIQGIAYIYTGTVK